MHLVHWSIAITLCKGLFIHAQHSLPVNDNDWAESNEFVFLRDEVTNITITMEEDDLDSIIADTDSDFSRNCTVRFQNSKVDETVTSVGIRARGNAQRNAKKFPWKLEFDEFVEDRKFLGCEKMNLSGDSYEPSLSRSSLALDIMRSMGVAASRSSYVWLTINDGSKVQGVYNSFEQVDEEFAQAWFDNKDGDNYKCRIRAEGADLKPLNPNTVESYEESESYEEKRTGSYQRLKDFIDFIDKADDEQFRNGLKNWINVDSFLRALAVDVAIGGWDNLWVVANNYYLMYDEDTAVFEYIPWDMDQSFGMDLWFFPLLFGTDWTKQRINNFGIGCFSCGRNENGPPLIDRVLEISVYEKQVEKYARETVLGPMSPPVITESIERISNLIQPLIYTGSFSGPTMDGGLTNEDFVNSFEKPSKYKEFAFGATWGILPFVRARADFILKTYSEDELSTIPVIVNELVANNKEGITDENGDKEDWVELYNDSDEPVDVSGFYLTDTYGLPRQWQIPSGTIIGARDYLVFWCDDDEDDGPLHTNFKLSSSGEGVYLYSTVYEDVDILVSSLVYPELKDDEAYGRLSDGGKTMGYLETPTPAESNQVDNFALIVEGFPPENLDIYAVGASPGGKVIFVFSFVMEGNGGFTIPDSFPCGGVMFDLSNPEMDYLTLTADDAGMVPIPLPGEVPSLTGQSLDLETCETSNIVVVNSELVTVSAEASNSNTSVLEGGSTVDLMEELEKLHDDGVLTDEVYTEAKSNLLQ